MLAGIAAAHGLDVKLARIFVGLGALVFPPTVFLYIAAWALLPREPEPARPLTDLARAGGRTWVLVGLAFLAFFAFMDGGWGPGPGRGGNLLGAALLVGLGVWLWSQRSTSPPAAPGDPGGPGGPTDLEGFGPMPPAVGATGAAGAAGGGTDPTGSPWSTAPAGYGAGGAAAGSGAPPWAPVPPAGGTSAATLAPPPPPAPPGPPVGRVTGALTLIALGAVIAGDRIGWYRLDVAAALAVLLGVVGLGLVVGAALGGGRGLIAPAVVLLVLTVGAASLGPVHLGGAIGDRTLRPATVAEATEAHDHGMGKLTVDLRELAFQLPVGETVTVPVDLGVGELRVIVPDGVNLEVAADLGIGRVDVLDRSAEGLGNDQTFRFDDPAIDRRLRLDLDVGIGHIDVDREPAAARAGTR